MLLHHINAEVAIRADVRVLRVIPCANQAQAEAVFLVGRVIKAIKVLIQTDKQ